MEIVSFCEACCAGTRVESKAAPTEVVNALHAGIAEARYGQ